ncbi:AAA family ATPase [Micromonospora sp. NPDC006766]|uniref:AAA family ATPase n=1 Tax=Micromonospora sp. NPDC006766 TaxID=3154778 RepID=UPI0033E8C8F8
MSDDLVMWATRGLPGCGKTTWARGWVDIDPAWRARVSRDDERKAMHGRRLGTPGQERLVTIACHGKILDLLRAGVSVVEDGTNLPDEHLVALWDIADRAGARFRVADFTRVPFKTCVARDVGREGEARLGRERILAMHQEFVQGRRTPLRLPTMAGMRRGNSVEVVDMARLLK